MVRESPDRRVARNTTSEAARPGVDVGAGAGAGTPGATAVATRGRGLSRAAAAGQRAPEELSAPASEHGVDDDPDAEPEDPVAGGGGGGAGASRRDTRARGARAAAHQGGGGAPSDRRLAKDALLMGALGPGMGLQLHRVEQLLLKVMGRGSRETGASCASRGSRSAVSLGLSRRPSSPWRAALAGEERADDTDAAGLSEPPRERRPERLHPHRRKSRPDALADQTAARGRTRRPGSGAPLRARESAHAGVAVAEPVAEGKWTRPSPTLSTFSLRKPSADAQGQPSPQPGHGARGRSSTSLDREAGPGGRASMHARLRPRSMLSPPPRVRRTAAAAPDSGRHHDQASTSPSPESAVIAGLVAWLWSLPGDARAQLHGALHAVAQLAHEEQAEGTQTDVLLHQAVSAALVQASATASAVPASLVSPEPATRAPSHRCPPAVSPSSGPAACAVRPPCLPASALSVGVAVVGPAPPRPPCPACPCQTCLARPPADTAAASAAPSGPPSVGRSETSLRSAARSAGRAPDMSTAVVPKAPLDLVPSGPVITEQTDTQNDVLDAVDRLASVSSVALTAVATEGVLVDEKGSNEEAAPPEDSEGLVEQPPSITCDSLESVSAGDQRDQGFLGRQWVAVAAAEPAPPGTSGALAQLPPAHRAELENPVPLETRSSQNLDADDVQAIAICTVLDHLNSLLDNFKERPESRRRSALQRELQRRVVALLDHTRPQVQDELVPTAKRFACSVSYWMESYLLRAEDRLTSRP